MSLYQLYMTEINGPCRRLMPLMPLMFEIFKKMLNMDLPYIFDWFFINKQSIHCEDDETKSILFENKHKRKSVVWIYTNNNISIYEQHFSVIYLVLVFKTINGQLIASTMINEVNTKLHC